MPDDPKPDDKPDPKPDDEPDPTPDDPKDWEAEATKWRELARKHETRSKENADAARKLRELEDADKSESQKLSEAHAAEKKRADDAENRALRLEVAADKGLTAKQAKRLVGATREELEADADDILEEFGSNGKGGKPPAGGKPKEHLRGGADPDEEPDEQDPRKLASRIPRG